MVRSVFLGLGVTDIFDEVSEDLRAERARVLLRRYGYLLVVAAVLIVAGVAGWQLWRSRQAQQRESVAATFIAAMHDADAPGEGTSPSRTRALEQFTSIANSGPEGYRTLAPLRAAALKADAGDLAGATALWDEVSADEAADPQLRNIANLLWVQHEVDKGDPAAVQGRLEPLIAPGNPWRAMALESQAWLQLRTGETDKARDTLRRLTADPLAPPGVRSRAGYILQGLGDAPAQASVAGKTGG